MHDEKKLDALCQQLLEAKTTESKANEDRIAIEAKIIALVGIPDEGAATHDTKEFKLRVEQRITRKLDERKWILVRDQIPEGIRPVTIEETFKIDTKGVHWLRDNEPGYYKLMCQAMEEKPSKPSVKVEVMK